jgi:endonuclease/exonuclease/phosphatase family metal-dependent hydrolase
MSTVIATWNIYWLGSTDPHKHAARSAEDERAIAEVIRRRSPDVLALQEIVDPAMLQRILALAGGHERTYVIEAGGQPLTSARLPLDPAQGRQSVFFCYDSEKFKVDRWAALSSPGGRRPLAVDFWHKDSKTGFTAVAVHLKAGWTNGFLDEDEGRQRREEAAALAAWLKGEATAENPGFPKPGYDRVVVLGDLNAELNLPGAPPRDPNDSLRPLADLAQQGWTIDDPAPDGEHRITSLFESDTYVIDLMLLSPAMADALTNPKPSVYAWDFDPLLAGPEAFHDGPGGSGKLKNYHVSDHRMVWAAADL